MNQKFNFIVAVLVSVTLITMKYMYPKDFSALWVVAPLAINYICNYALVVIQILLKELSELNCSKDKPRHLKLVKSDEDNIIQFPKKYPKPHLVQTGDKDGKDIS